MAPLTKFCNKLTAQNVLELAVPKLIIGMINILKIHIFKQKH